MKIKGQYSTFSFRPPGVLKSSVSTTPRPRIKPVESTPKQQMTRLALGIDPKNENLLNALKEIPPGMLFFCNLENVYLVIKDGVDGAIITDDLHVITESMYHCQNAQFFSDDLPDLQHIDTLDEIFISFDSEWMRYNHWMGYCLSKAYLASLYTPEHVKIVIPEYRENTHIPHPISKELYDSTLDKSGFKKRVLQLKDGIYKVQKLSYFWPNNYLPHAYFNFHDAKALFSHLNKDIKYRSDLPPRFFIKQDSAMDKILTEKENQIIQEALNQANIPAIDLKDMDWTTQISLFSQAELILSPHRPELVNLLFCSQDTEVIEFTRSLNNTNHLPAWPYLMASTHRMQYSFFDLDWTTLKTKIIEDTIRNLDSL